MGVLLNGERVVERAEATVSTKGIEMDKQLWWLSFCDTAKPAGEQFLGAAMVWTSAPGTAVDATRAAWDIGVNPGGEVMAVPIPGDFAAKIPAEYIGRLMNREQCQECNDWARRMRAS